MNTHLIGILIGGFVPLACFSMSGLMNKVAAHHTSTGIILLCTGIGVALVSIPFFLLAPAGALTSKGMTASILLGVLWGLGIGCVSLALSSYHAPYSVLVPIFNMNTLFVVLFSLVIFAEWKDVNLARLIIGAIFVVVGGTLVALA
jgi:drug/metabolite transporter (DMT)-like permease